MKRANGRRGPATRVERLIDYMRRDIWLKELGDLPSFKRIGVRLSRLLVLTGRGFHQHRSLVQAAALTYYTVLSIVPVLAVSFAVARGLGAYDHLREGTIDPFLDRYFSASAEGEEVAAAEAIGPAVAEAEEGTGGEEQAAGAEPNVEGSEAAPAPAEVPEVIDGGDADPIQVGAGEQPADLRQAVDYLLGVVDTAKPLALGIPGLALFLYAAIKLLSAVERALNEVWGIRRGRSWARRISDYISIVVITPILLLIGTAGMAAVRSVRALQSVWGDIRVDVSWLVGLLLQGVPLITFFVGLTFAYLALPNTRVRWRSAMIGGAAGAVLWLVSQHLYIELQVGIAKYNALYASFAAFPILLVWVFLSWAIFLIGAELCYAHQSVPMFTSIARMGVVDQSFRESLALRLCGRIADAFLVGEEPRDSAQLAKELGLSPRAVNQVLEALATQGILVRTDADEDRYLPACDPESTTVLDVLIAMRTEDDAERPAPHTKLDERVDRILGGLEREARESLHNHTLRELALSSRESRAEADPAEALQGRTDPAPSEG